jgi:hypothetical protein
MSVRARTCRWIVSASFGQFLDRHSIIVKQVVISSRMAVVLIQVGVTDQQIKPDAASDPGEVV